MQSRSWIEWITLIFSLLLLGGYIAWSLVTEHNGVEARERDRLSTQARVIDLNVAQQLDAIRRVLINVRQTLPRWQQQVDGMRRASQRLEAFSDALVGVRTLVIYDARGTIVAANRQEFMGRNFSEQDYFQNALKHLYSNTLYISAPFRSATGKWVIMVSMAIVTEQGQFDGLVAAALDPERFRITLNSVNYTRDMWCAIAHGDGIQFMMEPERPNQAGMNLKHPGSFFSRHMESGKPENVLSGTVYSTGENRMMAIRTIQPRQLFMDKPLVVAVGRDFKMIFLRWRRDALNRVLLYLLLSFTAIYGLYRLQRAQRNTEQDVRTAALAIDEKNRELEVLNEQLRSMALVDGLTSVANRRNFDDVFGHEWHRCSRDKTPLALLMIDIDHFKQYNDHYGHQAGDECLKKVADVFKEGFERGSDLIARYGGEEFSGLLPDTDLAGATALAESIRTKVAGLNILHEYSTAASYVTVSIGVAAMIPSEEIVPQTLITKADEALYKAKLQCRNCVVAAPD